MIKSERPSLEIIAPTVDEAVAKGLADLNLPAESVQVEVLDGGSRGLLGLGGRQARVRLIVLNGEAPSVLKERDADSESVESDALLETIETVVSQLIGKMGIEAQVTAWIGEVNDEGRKPLHVDLSGQDLTVLIGRRAEILNALQYLISLIVSRQMNQWVHVIVDVEGYRQRRENQLRHMARRMAEQAIRTGRRQVLEPMSAADRRIIHLELRDNPDVSTQSIGEEPARKVTILPGSY